MMKQQAQASWSSGLAGLYRTWNVAWHDAYTDASIYVRPLKSGHAIIRHSPEHFPDLP